MSPLLISSVLIVTQGRLPAQCLNHRLRMHQEVVGVLLDDVLAGLRTNLADEGLKQVERDLRLATTVRCLGRIELGKQAARDPLFAYMSFRRCVMDARAEGLNRRIVRTMVHLRMCWYRGDQTEHN